MMMIYCDDIILSFRWGLRCVPLHFSHEGYKRGRFAREPYSRQHFSQLLLAYNEPPRTGARTFMKFLLVIAFVGIYFHNFT